MKRLLWSIGAAWFLFSAISCWTYDPSAPIPPPPGYAYSFIPAPAPPDPKQENPIATFMAWFGLPLALGCIYQGWKRKEE